MGWRRTTALFLITVSFFSGLSARAEPGPHAGAMFRLPPVETTIPNAYVAPGFPTVQQVLNEVATDALDKLERRFLKIVEDFGTQGVTLLQNTVEQMLRANLSPKQMALLTTVLELAANEQVIGAAGGVANSRGLKFGPWGHLGQAIAIKLGAMKWGEMSPELKALRILSTQTMEILTLTPKARQEFRHSQTKFKEALVLLADEDLDGRGILRLAAASGSFIGSALKEVCRDVKLAVQPARLEKAMDAALLLANSIANTDPSSKVYLRHVLARELEIDRVKTNPDGSMNWNETLGEIAALSPDDARAVGKVLQSQGIITERDVRMMETNVQHMRDARDTVGWLGRQAKMPAPRTPQEFQRQMEEIKQLAAHLNRSGQLGDDVAVRTLQVASAMSAASHAQEAGRMIAEDLQNPITQRNLKYIGDRLISRSEGSAWR